MNMSKSQYELKKVLRFRLAEAQAKNPLYSMRAFANALGIQASALSEFLADKRQFSAKLQKKVIENLTITEKLRQKLLNLVDVDNGEEVSMERIQVDEDSYALVRDPINYSILCLIETKDYVDDHAWIAKRLQKTSAQVSEAFELLERIGYIKRIAGKPVVTDVHLMTSDDVSNMSLRLRHAENLDNAKDALLILPVEERYFRFETLAIGTDQLPEFKKAASEFLDRILFLSQQSEKNEVYEFSLNFFPRTTTQLSHKD